LQTNQATLGACNTAKATELVAARLFMQVQPNPANDVVTVFVGNASVETTISLMDANGRLLQTVTTNGTDGMAEQILNVSELPRGMYFVQAQNGGEIASDKLVIVR
jgi:hypothetical protein